MKKLFLIGIIASAVYACGPSNSPTGTTDDSRVINSPTGDTAITDHGTGAAKGAETSADTSANP